jgi:hypothetical protein
LRGYDIQQSHLGSKISSAMNCRVVSLQSSACRNKPNNQLNRPDIHLERSMHDGRKTHIDLRLLPTKKHMEIIPLTSALRDKQPWEVVHIDCCGPWKIRWHGDKSGRVHSFEIHLLSMVDACTAWSKFCCIKMASSLATSSGFDKNWLCRYPRPRKVVQDNGNEFMGSNFQEFLDSYSIEPKPTYDGKKSNCECNRGTNLRNAWRAAPSNSLWHRLERRRRHAYSSVRICSSCDITGSRHILTSTASIRT